MELGDALDDRQAEPRADLPAPGDPMESLPQRRPFRGRDPRALVAHHEPQARLVTTSTHTRPPEGL